MTSVAPNSTRAPPEPRLKSRRAAEQLARYEEELAGNQQVLESAAADVAGAQAELRQRQQEAQQATADLQQVEREQEQHRREIMDAVSAASNVRNRMIQAEERIADLERDATARKTRSRPPISSLKTSAASAGKSVSNSIRLSRR